ncbi:MAG: hypothetical protein HOL01_03830 [Planctomycetaceae bacterium]|jgi:hypothetical protein|nr:hypothetical protein [Planctomycetaceae bacterium]
MMKESRKRIGVTLLAGLAGGCVATPVVVVFVEVGKWFIRREYFSMTDFATWVFATLAGLTAGAVGGATRRARVGVWSALSTFGLFVGVACTVSTEPISIRIWVVLVVVASALTAGLLGGVIGKTLIKNDDWGNDKHV